MAEPENSPSGVLIDLAQFEAQDSDEGRLLRYAKGRLRSFWLRQALVAFGTGVIALLFSPWLGLVMALLALAGEAVDFALLRLVIGRLRAGQIAARARWPALIGALVQGATVAACAALCWQVIPLQGARFFAAAFLISAAINAGLARPHFKAAADVRLVIFLLTGFAMMASDLRQVELATSRDYGFFAASFAVLVYISLLFIRLSERNHAHRRRHDHALLRHQHERDLASAQLALSAQDSERLALVARYANDSIIISAPDGRIVWVNDSFTRITGYDFAEVVGRFPSDFLNAPGTDPATLARLEVALSTQTPVRAEILNRTKSGRLIWVETSIIPILAADGTLRQWIAVERDITDAKDREAELARARIAAEEAGQAKARFLATMSHEIRTPMNGVIGVAELLTDTGLTPVQASYVGTIQESGQALLGIINDILDMARLQSGKATLDEAPFSPRACIDSVLCILGPSATKKGLRLDSVAPEGLVLGDAGKLRQILLNLVGNAVKFTHEGAVSVTLRLPDAGSDVLEIAVTDSGIGIPSDRIGAIFESFSQADSGIGRQFGGTGLGLTICAMLAERMGGGIAVTSDIGTGSVFTLRAKLPRTASDVVVLPLAERRSHREMRPGLRVMVAEDNRTNMMILRKMLQGAVGALFEAPDGEVALTLYKQDPPDLILMDVSMPVKDGLQATRDIRAHERLMGLAPCPILALTANALGEDREAGRLAGLDGFLVKPLSRADLLAAISAHCPDTSPRAQAIGL